MNLHISFIHTDSIVDSNIFIYSTNFTVDLYSFSRPHFHDQASKQILDLNLFSKQNQKLVHNLNSVVVKLKIRSISRDGSTYSER